ncbi:MAG: right-handed parallel beta-helix repeat-containing protein [Spirochaetes bacterium]|nr:right-handed parallel beta-helix repeat-containing protein [Spirochaetota bacterium]
MITVSAAAAEYHVATNGSDGNNGTRDKPLLTIQKAADLMKAGDRCIVRAGTYRETVTIRTSGADENLITFTTDGGNVVITGLDEVTSGWTAKESGVYQTDVDGPVTQVFSGTTMLYLARCPNAPLNDLMNRSWATAGQGTDYDILVDTNLPPGNWDGATVFIWPGHRWYSKTPKTTGYQPGTSLRFDPPFQRSKGDAYHGTVDVHRPVAGNPYYLYNSAAGLDAPGEWFFNTQERLLSLIPPDGKTPQRGSIEIRRRPLALDITADHISFTGFVFFAGGVQLKGNDNRLSSCEILYPDSLMPNGSFSGGCSVQGDGTALDHVRLAYAAGPGITVRGNDNRILQCVMHDLDYCGGYYGGVNVSGTTNTTIDACTLYRTGRDIVLHHKARGLRITGCDIFLATMLNNDSGATYAWGTDGGGSIIASNWVHDCLGEAAAGIYLDNFCSNFYMHHNIIWNINGDAIRLNSDSLNNLVAFNTIKNVNRAFATFTYTGRIPTMLGTRIVNNNVITPYEQKDPSTFVQGERGPLLRSNFDAAVDAAGVPVSGSAAIAAAFPLDEFPTFSGQPRDVGAMQSGGKPWRPGASWWKTDIPGIKPMDLSYSPGAGGFPTSGLRLWLDGDHTDSFEMGFGTTIRTWKSRTAGDERSLTGTDGITRESGWNGHFFVRFDGTSAVRAGTFRTETGGYTLFVVARSDGTGGQWQRLFSTWNGTMHDYQPPNCSLMRPDAQKPQPFPARLFFSSAVIGRSLEAVVIGGQAEIKDKITQCFNGDIAEILLYDRSLSPTEKMTVQMYLKKKWGLE